MYFGSRQYQCKALWQGQTSRVHHKEAQLRWALSKSTIHWIQSRSYVTITLRLKLYMRVYSKLQTVLLLLQLCACVLAVPVGGHAPDVEYNKPWGPTRPKLGHCTVSGPRCISTRGVSAHLQSFPLHRKISAQTSTLTPEMENF